MRPFVPGPMSNATDLDYVPKCVNLTAYIKNISTHPIAIGGFSELYSGDLVVSHPPRKIVVKVLRTRTYGKHTIPKAFKEEAAIMEVLTHPNIAEYCGVSFHLGRPAIVMARYTLGDAPTYLKSRPEPARLYVIKGALKGLHYLHSQTPPIVHGDIKGVNILVNDSLEGVLCDFGLSHVVTDIGESMGGADRELGTVRWMAPELIHKEPDVPPTVGHTLSSDVWAFGCTYYELLLGIIPYKSCRTDWLVVIDIIEHKLPFSEEAATREGAHEMWPVLKMCWRSVPGNRPTTSELKTLLDW